MWSKFLPIILVILENGLCQMYNNEKYNTSDTKNIQNITCTLKHDRCDIKQLNRFTREFNISDSENIISDIYNKLKYDEYLLSTSVIYGLIVTSMDNNMELNPVCYKEMETIYQAIHQKEVWAMKLLDSSATSQPGFILGNNFWLGSIQGCTSINIPLSITISNRFNRIMKPNLIDATAPFNADYRIVHARHQSPWQIEVEFLMTEKILHLGLCLPTSCTDEEIFNLTQNYFNGDSQGAQKLFEITPEVINVKSLKLNDDFFSTSTVKILGCFMLLTMMLFIIAFLYESYKNNYHIDDNNNNSSEINNNLVITNNDAVPETPVRQSTNESKLLIRLLKCFSIKDNFKMLISMEKPKDSIPIIDGIKSIGCFSILIFHLHWYMHYSVHNPAMIFAYGENIKWVWITTTPILVDAFFLLSGMLLSYNLARNEQKLYEIRNNNLWQNSKLFGRQLLHRYLRLTPLYLVLIGLTQVSTSYIVQTSPFYVVERYDEVCPKYWWRNALYIQNLFNVTDLCLNWTWSLACEMQFFIFSTILLFIYAKNRRRGRKIFWISFCGFILICLYITLKTEFTPAFDVMHDLAKDIYIAPWSRILPYMVGIYAGWTLLLITKRNFKIEKKWQNLLTTLSLTIIISSHNSTMNRSLSYIYAAPLMTAIRIFYAGSIAWLILNNAMGSINILAKILNHKIFVHINKLSYGIYLINPFFISLIYGLRDTSTHVDPVSNAIMCVGTMIFVYLLAFILTLFFEVPFTKLSNEILAKRKVKTS